MGLEKNFRKNLAPLIGIVISTTSLTGCMTIPEIGEFHPETSVNIPSHPAIMALTGGKLRAEKIYNEKRETGFDIEFKHWTGIYGGKQRINYCQSSSDYGMRAGGNLFSSWVDSRENCKGTHYLTRTNMSQNCSNVTSRETWILEKRNGKWGRTRKIQHR